MRFDKFVKILLGLVRKDGTNGNGKNVLEAWTRITATIAFDSIRAENKISAKGGFVPKGVIDNSGRMAE